MKTKELLEARARLISEMRGLTNAPAGNGGDLSDEQASKFDSLKAELSNIEKRIDRQRLIDEAERRMAGETVSGSGDDRLDTALEGFSLRRAILSQVPGHAEDCQRERELSNEIARRAGRPFQGIAIPMNVFHRRVEQRVMTTALPGGGPAGNLIGTDHLGSQYIDVLRAQMQVRRLGARVLTGLVGNVSIPKLMESASTGWVSENSALTPSDQEHDSLTLEPRHCGGIVEFSRNLLLQSSPDIEQLIREDFAKVLAREADRVAINGGASNEPVGVLAHPDVDGLTDMTPPTWAGVLSLVETVEEGNAEGTAFLTDSAVIRKLRSTVRVSSTDSRMIMEESRALANFPLAMTSLVSVNGNSPAGHRLIFGNWSDLLMGFWSELDILVNPYESTAYSKGNVQVRGMMTADIALRHGQSFAFADVDTTP